MKLNRTNVFSVITGDVWNQSFFQHIIKKNKCFPTPNIHITWENIFSAVFNDKLTVMRLCLMWYQSW